MARCDVCFRHCELKDGQTGPCGARAAEGGEVRPVYYGKVSALALDPIEKKPLAMFHPGSRILSVGMLGCNLHCPFCQNHEIAQREGAEFPADTRELSPVVLAEMADNCRDMGNIGVAFTYNEPLVCWEYVHDTAKLVHEKGMLNVMVTNGCADLGILEKLSPYIDAMNIDLKGFTDRYYRDVLGGDRKMVMDFIREAVKRCHVELTTLVVPGENDSEEEMRELSGWVAGLQDVYGGKPGSEIPLHISRFFPRYRMTGKKPTDVGKVYSLVRIAEENLRYVYPGNC
ncbi:AmmeMemoRadiSam system radical SAM enzyme [Clostridiales bacterium]|nr:AmmeMemoRadiSam system radical SAM enzyme [Clostridiales bacterium]